MLASTVVAQQSNSGYHVAKDTTVGGVGSWDYLAFDSHARRLYISHDTRVEVFNPDLGRVIGDIPDTDGVHGIALAKDLGRGFISSGKANTVIIFNLKTLKVISKVNSTGQDPDCIIYDPASKRIFTFNGLSGTATAINPLTGEVLGTIDLGGSKPEFAAADGKGHVWVNLEDKDTTVELDSVKLKVVSHLSLGECHQPSSLAMDIEHRRLFVGCRSKVLVVLDSDSGGVVATLPIGAGVDANVYDPRNDLVFTANRDGTLTVIHEDSPNSYAVVDTVSTQAGAGSLALDAKTGNLYTVTAELGPALAATKEQPRPRPLIVPGTFKVLTITK
jgi:DNA-binding beta-propeller fold protein YncE